MIPIAVAANTARPASSSFFSERTESDCLSPKLTKSPGRLLKPACWAAVVLCILSAGCKQSTQAPAPPPPPVTVATPVDKEIVEYAPRLSKAWTSVRA